MDPYAVLGLPADSDDEAIRRRYLELVRQYSPEQHPQEFSRIRQAYENLRDLDTLMKSLSGASRLPEGVTVRVHDSTADMRYLVLPLRPAGTEGLSETELAELVTRDSMIGVAVPQYKGSVAKT